MYNIVAIYRTCLQNKYFKNNVKFSVAIDFANDYSGNRCVIFA